MTHEYNIKNNNNILCVSLILLILILSLSLYSINTSLNISLDISDFLWSLLFILIIATILFLRFYINKANIVSLYSLFFLTSLLFIGGRFFSVILGFTSSPLFELDFFVYSILNAKEKTNLFFLVISGFLSLELGYYFSNIILKNDIKKSSNVFLNANKYVLIIIILIIFSLLSISSYESLKIALDGGYLALYSGQTKEYGFTFTGLLKTILLASAGIFLSQKNVKIQRIFLLALGVYFLIDIFLGARGGFISYILFLVWYKHDFGKKKGKFINFFIIVIILIVLLSTIFGLISLRSSEVTDTSIYQKILSLLYDQGVTLMVFNESLKIQEYPAIPYFQNFIPGFSFLYSKIIGGLYPYEISFSAFLSYTLNPKLYDLGYGLGWSFFSDAYLYGFKTPTFFCFWVFIFSVFLNYLQLNITKNIYVKVITISLVSSILFLPRAGINTIFPLIPYILILFFIIKLFSRLNTR